MLLVAIVVYQATQIFLNLFCRTITRNESTTANQIYYSGGNDKLFYSVSLYIGIFIYLCHANS